MLLPSRGEKGFTLVEMLVAIGIFVILGTVGLVSFMRNRRNTDLEASVSELASNVRKMQSYTRSGKSIDNPNIPGPDLEVPRAYGISFDRINYPGQYKMYADFGTLSNWQYDEVDTGDGIDVLIDTYDLARNTLINYLSATNLRAEYERLDIVFEVPTSKLIISAFNAADGWENPPFEDLPTSTVGVQQTQSLDSKNVIIEGGFLGGVTIEE